MESKQTSDETRQRARQGAADPATAAFGATLAATRREVDARLEAMLDEERAQAARHGPDTAAVSASVRELTLRGGKRARPALAVAGFVATPGSDAGDLGAVYGAGVALELLQTYLLIHDDWMDGDVTRRGGPTVHVLLGQHYKDARLGEVGAILAGDYACALAQKALFKAAGPSPHGASVATAFARMQRDVVFGQILDVGARAEDVETMHELKTASYTVMGPVELGAHLAGADVATLTALRGYARPLGVAFQMCDDLLSAFGSEASTGKARGNDLRAGKRTAVVVEAEHRMSPAERSILAVAYGHPGASVEAVEAAIAVLDRCGARAAVEARRDALLGQSLEALEGGVAGGVVTERGALILRGAARALAVRDG